MVSGEKEKSENESDNRQIVPDMDCNMEYLREKLCQLERMLSQKEKYGVGRHTEVTLEIEKDFTSDTIPISEGAASQESLQTQMHDIEYSAEDYIQQIANFEQKFLGDENYSEKNYYQQAAKQISILELYKNLRMLEENHKYNNEESGKLPESFQKRDEVKCETKKHSCFQNKKLKKKVVCSHISHKNPKHNCCTNCNSKSYEHNPGFKSDRSQLNISPETTRRQVPLKKTICSCYELSLSSDDSEESFHQCSHVQNDYFNETCGCNCKDVKSDSSSEDQTTCSEVSKCTCYCSKDHSHGESSDDDSEGEVYHEKKKKQERFRGGLDVIKPNTRKIMKYDKNVEKDDDCPTATNVSVENLKTVKVEELREGLERLKIRNRNLRDFLETLQNPINLMGKSSEANTICTKVSSCYTFDVARQTRSGLLTVVEVLKGKCQTKDAVIVALADELKTKSDKKIDVAEVETDKILTQDKSLVWNGLIEGKKSSRKFTKKESAIGFAIFLMILISHVKRSEMISYFSAAKKILTQSPFKLSLFMNEAENFSFDFISTYYQNFAHSIQTFVKYSFDRWAIVALQVNHWFVSNSGGFKKYIDIVNNFLITNQSSVLISVCAVVVGIFLINIRNIWANSVRFIREEKYKLTYFFLKSCAIQLAQLVIISCKRLLASKIFWFTMGFCSQILYNMILSNSYGFFDIPYMKNANSLLQHLNETQELADSDDEIFSYSWLVSIFCNKFQSFVQSVYSYILKNI